MKQELTITVSGQFGSGKSRLTFLLKEFLRKEGFEVNFEGNTDHPTEAEFDRTMVRNIVNTVDNIKETRVITLKEEQLPRVLPVDKAIKYIQESYCDEHIGYPYMLLGDVAEVLRITTGKGVAVSELAIYGKE